MTTLNKIIEKPSIPDIQSVIKLVNYVSSFEEMDFENFVQNHLPQTLETYRTIYYVEGSPEEALMLQLYEYAEHFEEGSVAFKKYLSEGQNKKLVKQIITALHRDLPLEDEDELVDPVNLDEEITLEEESNKAVSSEEATQELRELEEKLFKFFNEKFEKFKADFIRQMQNATITVNIPADEEE